MQTFLPYPSFTESARVLDRQRLGKQRVEAWQILRTLTGESKGWDNHPAVRMWRGYEVALAEYGMAICAEWIWRGYRDTMHERFVLEWERRQVVMPQWLGDPAFHASHRAALLAKDAAWYSQFGWTEAPAVRDAKGSLPYVWPA